MYTNRFFILHIEHLVGDEGYLSAAGILKHFRQIQISGVEVSDTYCIYFVVGKIYCRNMVVAGFPQNIIRGFSTGKDGIGNKPKNKKRTQE